MHILIPTVTTKKMTQRDTLKNTTNKSVKIKILKNVQAIQTKARKEKQERK